MMDISNNPLSKDGGLKKSTGIVLAALLIFGAVAGVLTVPFKDAYAAVTITTSANQFYGNSFAQVLIDDSAKNSASTTKETVSVTVKVRDNTGAEKATGTINAREIGTNSGQFEFFITAGDNGVPAVPRSESNPNNAALLRANADPTNPGANGTALDTGATDPANNWKFVIEYGGLQKELSYKTTNAAFNLDRSTVGSENNVIFMLTDQDGNVDPTKADVIKAFSNTTGVFLDSNGDEGNVTNDYLMISGSFSAGNFSMTETGANTGVFEKTYNVGTITTDSTSTYSLTNFDIYGPSPEADHLYQVTPTTTKIDRSLVLQNADGALSSISNVTFGSEIPITVTDPDQNKNSRSEDTITGKLTASLSGGDSETVTLTETGDNTGIFKANLNNGLLPVTFLSASGSATNNNGVLELTAANVEDDDDIVISYEDPVKSGGQEDVVTATIRMPLSHVAGKLSFDASKAQSTDKIGLTLTDMDLNNNPNAIDSFTVATASNSRTYSMKIGSTTYENVAQFTMKIKGSSTLTPESVDTMTFVETGANTGVFKGQMDISKIDTSGNSTLTLNDGDQIELKYEDNLEDPDATSAATVTIGKATTGISVDKTTSAFPTSATDTIKVRLTITDTSRNTNSGIQDTLASSVIDANSTSFDISATKSDGTSALVIGTGNGANTDIFYNSFSLRETGANTGVFTGQVTIGKGDGGTLAELDNAKLKVVYDSSPVTVTMRPSDMVLTTDKTSVQNGEDLVVKINDPDRNRDPESKDRVTFSLTTQNDVISVADLGALTSVTAEETGADTGVFEKKITLGSDLRVTLFSPSSSTTSIVQAREIKVSATEAVATDLTSAARDKTVSVKTNTGKISIKPEVIGPGTELTIMVEDKDLTANPSGVETILPLSTLDLLSITTDRSGFGIVRPGLEETGPNTGIFQVKLKLSPMTGATPTTSGGATSTTAGATSITGQVLPGDIISIKYTDNKDAGGAKVVTSKVLKVMSADPQLSTSSNATGVGDALEFSIADADANRDGQIIDSVKVKVTSDSDPVGFDVTGLETDVNTGVFTFVVQTSATVSSGALVVAQGDNVYAKYTDTYPADYVERKKQVNDPSKDFILTIPIGSAVSDINSTTPSKPALKSIDGSDVSEVTSGSQVILSSSVKNNNDAATPFAAIVEVRNEDGVTVYLQWQTGTISANGDINVGLSWTPEEPGTYKVRTFVLSSISDPQVLSPVAESEITVS